MKKSFSVFAIMLILIMSGCSGNSRNITVATPMNVSTPVTVYVDGQKENCATCATEAPVNKCAKQIKMVNYNDSCHNLCGYTVTQRFRSNCDD